MHQRRNSVSSMADILHTQVNRLVDPTVDSAHNNVVFVDFLLLDRIDVLLDEFELLIDFILLF